MSWVDELILTASKFYSIIYANEVLNYFIVEGVNNFNNGAWW